MRWTMKEKAGQLVMDAIARGEPRAEDVQAAWRRVMRLRLRLAAG